MRLINLYKVTALLNIIFSSLAFMAYIIDNPNDNFLIYLSLFLLMYIPFMLSVLIGIKVLNATARKVQLKEEYSIVGYIANVITFLETIGLVLAEIYFFYPFIKRVHGINDKVVLVYLIMFGFLIWNLICFFNSGSYHFIVKQNKNIRFVEVDEIGDSY